MDDNQHAVAELMPQGVAALGHRWRRGQSGNPKGRKRLPAEEKVNRALAEEAHELLPMVAARAQRGEQWAIKLIFRRAFPEYRPKEKPVRIPGIDRGTFSDRGQAILDAAAKGRLAPYQASMLLSGLEALARTQELDMVKAKLEELARRQAEAQSRPPIEDDDE